MTNNANLNLINKAKQYAREAIHETWPTAKEAAKPNGDMYEYDAIIIDEEACPIGSVAIMHDPDADAFALVERARPAAPQKEPARQPRAFRFDNPINWDKLAEDHAIAYLRGDLATSSPQSYTIEEMKAISDGMFANTAEVEAAMRKEFQELSPDEREGMLDLLRKVDPENFGWWTKVLICASPHAR